MTHPVVDMSTERTFPASRYEAIRFTPEAIWSEIWRGLADAVRAPNAPWRLPALASTAEDGRADVRTVVLRSVDRDPHRLVFYTDRRSPKVAQLERDARVAWVFYDPVERVQLRIPARARLHRDDAVAEACWTGMSPESRRTYLAVTAPGTTFDEPFVNLPTHASGETASASAGEAGRANFAVVVTEVESVDWYYLHPDGHLRLRFDARSKPLHWEWLAS